MPPAAALGRRAIAVSLALAGAAGCGLGWVDGGGGGDHLPTQGAGPYEKPALDFETPADEPYVLAEARVHLRDPAALPRAGGGFRLWFGREEVDSPGSEIWYAELPAITELPDRGPEPALAADQPWEEGRVGAPTVLEQDDGSLVMYYQGGSSAPAIGRAVSDDGVSWRKDSGNPLLPGLGPGVGALPGSGLVLYFTRPDQPGIWHADSGDGTDWSAPRLVLAPRPDEAEAFDRDGVADPFVAIRRTAAGRTHLGLFFTGTLDDGEAAEASIGWAGSFDGLEWARFATPDGPVLAPGGESERGPSAVLEPDKGVLFFHETRQGVDRIAVATHP